MSVQSKTPVELRGMTLFICLWISSACAVADTANAGKTVSPGESAGASVTDATLRSKERLTASEMETPTATLLQRVRNSSRRQAAEAAFSLSILAIEREDLAAAEQLIQESLQLQPSNPGYLQVAASLAFKQGEFAEAQAYQQETLKVSREVLGAHDLRVVLVMEDLGTIYLAQGEYEQAERIWRESLSLREQLLGEMHPSLAQRLKDLAGVVMHSGRLDETEQLLKRMIAILEADREGDPENLASAQHVLADFYVSQQRMDEAAERYRLALAGWSGTSAQRRLEVAANIYQLGNEYLSQLRLEEAKPQFQLVLALLDEFAADHPYVQGASKALERIGSGSRRSAGDSRLDNLGEGQASGGLLQHRQIM